MAPLPELKLKRLPFINTSTATPSATPMATPAATLAATPAATPVATSAATLAASPVATLAATSYVGIDFLASLEASSLPRGSRILVWH